MIPAEAVSIRSPCSCSVTPAAFALRGTFLRNTISGKSWVLTFQHHLEGEKPPKVPQKYLTRPMPAACSSVVHAQ